MMVSRKPKRRKVSKKWHDLLCLIPGYDPFETAEPGDWFDPKIAQRYLDFFEHPECGMLHHIEGKIGGAIFTLEPWQRSIVANTFGWQRRDDAGRAVRRFVEVFLYVARKNGKTPFVAGLCNAVWFLEEERGKTILCAASDREQADLLFRHAKGMVEEEPELLAEVQIYKGLGQRSMVMLNDPASGFKILSSDADKKHGRTPSMAAIDEVHAHKNRDLVDAITTAMTSKNRAQPLTVYMTTADFDRPSICNELHEYSCKVRDGIFTNSRFLPIVYEVPLDDEWTDEKVWRKANPNLGVSVDLATLRVECQRAKDVPAKENIFRRLHLNQRTTTDVVWMKMDKWDACGGVVDPEELVGRDCYGGLDLSSNTDVSAFVLYFPEADGPAVVLPFFWIPEANAHARERRDRVPYETWERQGLITMTSGDIIDHNQIQAEIIAKAQQFNIIDIGVDRFDASQIIVQLGGEGLDMVPFGQGYVSMSSPTKDLERLVIAALLAHGGNPILRWMASNLVVDMDAAGNIKPNKAKSTAKIDGIVALIMAIGRAMAQEDNTSCYENEDLVWV